jgi:cell division protein FtsB
MRWLAGALLLSLIWLQYRLWVGDGSLAEVRALRVEIAAQQEELAQLRARNQALEAEVQDLHEGLDALEERARSELGMIKEGELFLQVIEETEKPGAGAPARADEVKVPAAPSAGGADAGSGPGTGAGQKKGPGGDVMANGSREP